MHINSNPPTGIEGTSLASAKGGESDLRAREANRQQAATKAFSVKTTVASEISAGEQTDDRNPNGQQIFDTFERADDQQESSADQPAKQTATQPNAESQDSLSGNLTEQHPMESESESITRLARNSAPLDFKA